jgi:hypothetical protein
MIPRPGFPGSLPRLALVCMEPSRSDAEDPLPLWRALRVLRESLSIEYVFITSTSELFRGFDPDHWQNSYSSEYGGSFKNKGDTNVFGFR